MASAQQKPKVTSADKRNPNRRNGKAFGKNHHNMSPKPTGKSILGYKNERVEKWAREAKMTTDEWVAAMKEGRRRKRMSAAEKRARKVPPCPGKCCNSA